MPSRPHVTTRIRSHGRRPRVDGAGAHLAEIAKYVKADPDVLVSACKWATAAGVIQDEHRVNVLQSLLEVWRWRSRAADSARLIEAFGLDRAAAISTPDPKGETVADIVLDAMRSDIPPAARLVDWLMLMGPSDWMGWSGQRHGSPNPAGVAIYELAMFASQGSHTSALAYLFDHGLDPHLRYPSGRPLAASIKHRVDLEAFMAAGGNLRACLQVNDHAEPSPMVLWEFLRKDSDLRAVIDQWSSVNEPEQISRKLACEYWKRLSGYATASEISGCAKSHPQWNTIQDERGRNCAMYLLRLHTSCHRFLATKQCDELLLKRDHDGHDIWFHALSIASEKHTPVKETFSLLALRAPKTPNPISGRGLLAEMLLDKDFEPGLFCGLQTVFENKKAMKSLPATKWLAGSGEDMDQVAALILRSALDQGDNRISKANLFGICNILIRHANDIQHPSLGWATIVALAESDLLKDLDEHQLGSLVAISGKTIWSAEEEAVIKKHSAQQAPIIVAALSQNQMNQMLQSTPEGRLSTSAPRF